MYEEFQFFQTGDLVRAREHPYYVNLQEGLGFVISANTHPIGQRYYNREKQTTDFKVIQFVEVLWQANDSNVSIEVPNYLLELVYRDPDKPEINYNE